jgi:trk system potassium uptake protein TrkA
VQWTTDRVLRRILPDAPTTEWTDPSAGVVLVERPVAPTWAGRRLADLDVPGLARVAALSRLGVGQVPAPDLVTQEGDVVYMSVVADRLAELDAHLDGTDSMGGDA